MKKVTRIWSLLLVVIMLVSLAPTAMAETERKTVTIGLALNTNVEDYNTNAYTLWVEEQMNVDLEFVLFEDISQKLPVMVNSGSELPDLIFHSFNSAMIMNWASQGVIVPLTEYWKKPEYLEPFYAVSGGKETGDRILASITMLDGEIYTMPTYDANLWVTGMYRMWIYQPWLEKLGMEMPTTTEEFATLLRRVVSEDPNGNGLKDEVGMTSSSAWGSHPIVYLMNSFVHCNPDSDYMNIENGKVVPAFTQDAFKAGLEYLNGLYAEGLIDPMSFTQDQNQMRALLNGEAILCGAATTGTWRDFQEDRQYDYVMLPPLMGPEGVHYTAVVEASPQHAAFITADADDPELCFQIASLTYNIDNRMLSRYGLPGENWTNDPEVISQYQGNFEALGYKPRAALINDVWGKQQNVNWGREMPYILFGENLYTEPTGTKRIPGNEEFVHWLASHVMTHTEFPSELIGTLIHTEEETEVVNSVAPSLISYVEEMATAFVVGHRSLDEWDSYLSELSSMGLDEYVSVLQTAYDRKIGK